MTTHDWTALARRIIAGLSVRRGELIELRDHAGLPDLVYELAYQVDLLGATPLLSVAPPDHMRRLFDSALPDDLHTYDRHRASWLQQVDRVAVLTSGGLGQVNPSGLNAWLEADARLTDIEEARRLPMLFVAVPTPARADELGLTLDQLTDRLFPALTAEIVILNRAIDKARKPLTSAQTLTIRSGDGLIFTAQRGDRPLHADDGFIDDDDRQRGAIVSNLPAGSLYTTILEPTATGQLHFPQFLAAREVTLTFTEGRISHITAADPAHAALLNDLFNEHTGEPRRISHIGLGLNPFVTHPLGWTLVDEHVSGMLFIAFGENRYMGGQNESSLNLDVVLPNATLLADATPIVTAGRLA